MQLVRVWADAGKDVEYAISTRAAVLVLSVHAVDRHPLDV
jgi:hypothetical protein